MILPSSLFSFVNILIFVKFIYVQRSQSFTTLTMNVSRLFLTACLFFIRCIESLVDPLDVEIHIFYLQEHFFSYFFDNLPSTFSVSGPLIIQISFLSIDLFYSLLFSNLFDSVILSGNFPQLYSLIHLLQKKKKVLTLYFEIIRIHRESRRNACAWWPVGFSARPSVDPDHRQNSQCPDPEVITLHSFLEEPRLVLWQCQLGFLLLRAGCGGQLVSAQSADVCVTPGQPCTSLFLLCCLESSGHSLWFNLCGEHPQGLLQW